MKIGWTIRKDEHGLKYREVYDFDHEGCVVHKGRLYETLPDSRKQPKSLAMKLTEERK